MLNSLTPTIARALAVFSVMVIISVISVSVSYVYMDGAYQEKQSVTRAMRIWQSKINNSVTNNQIIDQFEANFLKLVNQGVVGTEDRLSWFETLQNAAKKRGMPLVKYRISSQEEFKENNIMREYAGINVYKSIMTLDITMAHEGDLFALFNDLKKASGLYTVDRCDIEKITDDSAVTNNMKARCVIGWYTLRGEKADKNRGKAG